MTPEFWAGCSCGIVQTIVGFPFDSIKTRQQQSLPDVTRQHLYRGVVYQLTGKSLLSGGRFHLERILANQLPDNRFLTGALMGFLSSPFLNPFEIAKVRRQVGLAIPQTLPGFYRGWPLYASREIVGNSIFFGIFHHGHDDWHLSYPLAGILAGLFSWLVIHPVDTIKSRYQADFHLSYHQAWQVGHLYRGFWSNCWRICLTNLAGYWCYQTVYQLFKS